MWSSAKRAALCLATLAAGVPALAGAADLRVTVADLQGRPLADAVIYATHVGAPAPPAAAIPHAMIDQVDREFSPLVSVVRTGTEVRFPNSDNIRHSIYSFSAPKVFTEKLYSGKQAPPVIFDKPGLVVLGCNIHDQMVAWVVVVDTPYFGKSDAHGIVELKNLPPGDYELAAWYPGPTFEPKQQSVHLAAEAGPLTVSLPLDTASSPLPALKTGH